MHIISNKNEQHCKPSSVVDDHLSNPAVTGRLKRPTRKHDGPPYSSLFGLASDGVYMCPHCYQCGGELLPRLSTLTRVNPGGLFLLHWPGSHLHRTLSGILPCEARTFLTCGLSTLAAAIIYAAHLYSTHYILHW